MVSRVSGNGLVTGNGAESKFHRARISKNCASIMGSSMKGGMRTWEK